MNGELVVVAGLIALAVGSELVIAHPNGDVSVSLSLLLFGRPVLYLLAQTVYLWAVTRTPSAPRLGGLAALVVAGGLSLLLAPFAALAFAASVLALLALTVLREQRGGLARARAES